jgi:hypothetical protein
MLNMSLIVARARAYSFSSNRAGCSLIAAFGRSCPIHQRLRSLWAPEGFFARYVVASVPFMISFFTNKAHINTKLWEYWTLLQDKPIRDKDSSGLQHLGLSQDQHSAHRKLTASSSPLQPAAVWQHCCNKFQNKTISASIPTNCEENFNNLPFLSRRQTTVDLQLFQRQDKESTKSISTRPRRSSSQNHQHQQLESDSSSKATAITRPAVACRSVKLTKCSNSP